MTTSMTDFPFVPVLLAGGGREVLSLPVALDRAGETTALCTGSSLGDAALTRLLLGCYTAASTTGQAPGEWARSWLEGVTVTGGDRPFLQAPVLAEHARWDQAGKPLTVLDVFATGAGPVLVDHRHHHHGWAPGLPAAVRLLVERSVFDVGGLHPYPRNTTLGKGVGYAKVTPGVARPFLWVQGPTLADTLAWSHVPDTPGAPTPQVSWPDGATPGGVHRAGGIAEGLIYPSRAALLDPVGERVMFGAGLHDPADPAAAGDVALYPHTVRVEGKDGALGPARATLDPFRAVTTLARSVLAGHGITGTTPPGGEWRWVGLGAYQSRIDGVMDVTLPAVTADPVKVGEALDAITAARESTVKRAYATGGSWEGSRKAASDAVSEALAGPLSRAVAVAVADPDRGVALARDVTRSGARLVAPPPDPVPAPPGGPRRSSEWGQSVARALLAARRSADLPVSLRSWTPGTVTHDMVRVLPAGEAPTGGFVAAQHVAAMFAVFGPDVDGWGAGDLGHWVAVTAQDPAATLARVSRAGTPVDLHAALTGAAASPARAGAPEWAVLVDDLTDWVDPARRGDVLARWARSFEQARPGAPATHP